MKRNRPSMFLHADTLDVIMVGLLFFVLMALVCFSILKLQSLHHAYAGVGTVYGNRTENLSRIWGCIYDRDGDLIGGNYFEMQVGASRVALEKMGYKKFREVASLLEINDSKAAYKKLMKIGNNRVQLKTYPYQDFDYRHISRALRKMKMSSLLVFYPRNRRYYPKKRFYSSFLSYASPNRDKTCGIESSMNGFLSGEPGKREYAHSRIIPSFTEQSAVDGDDVVLTIDSAVQFIVETELKKQVRKTRARGGYVLVTQPDTGEILSFAGYYPGKIGQNVLGVAARFEPGSTIKPLLASALLDRGTVSTRFHTFCENGRYKLGKRTIRDHIHYGDLSLPEIIWHSSNIGAVKLGRLMSDQDFYDALRSFGLGAKTDIKLPGENAGRFPDPKNWGEGTKTSMSFGYGLSVNLVQMTAALNTVVNGGTWETPRIVKQVIGPDGKAVELERKQVSRRVISELTSAKMRDILRGVVMFGTGKEAAVRGVDVGGKTGTARKVVNGRYTRRYRASFFGFFPVSHPEVSVFIIIDEPKTEHYGGKVAAPLFHNIAQKILPLLIDEIGGIDMDMGLAAIVPTRLPESRSVRKGRIPDLEGLAFRDALILAHQAGYRVRYTGHGFVKSQSLPAGLVSPDGTLIRLAGSSR
ncbi:MAG: transpeptidase family protein [Holophagae bacterium]|nr:transpeptidase family protein [Holophagae bacterium]